MAEAFLKKHGGDQYEAYGAVTNRRALIRREAGDSDGYRFCYRGCVFQGSKSYGLSVISLDFALERGEVLISSPLSNSLPIQIVDPSHPLNVTYCPQISLGRRKIRMPEDHFAHDFYRYA
jgi:hypothetical protein